MNKKLTISIAVVSVVLIGAVLAAQFTGLINLKPIFADLPLVGRFFADGGKSQLVITPLEDENAELREKINHLERELERTAEELSGSLDKSDKEWVDLLAQNEKLQAELEEIKHLSARAAELAEYYKGMKADEAVRIFENLDDETVILILQKMEPDAVGKILAAMEPIRAAKITKVLTDIDKGASLGIDAEG